MNDQVRVLIEQLGLEVTVRQVGEAQPAAPSRAAVPEEGADPIVRFAGGIAHELNNLLTAIAGYNELILARMSESNPLRRDAGEIERAVDRAGLLSRHLLAVARRQVLPVRTIDLNGLVARLEPSLRETCGPGVVIELALDPRGPQVRGSTEQLQETIVLLAESAASAMAGRGTLRIRTTLQEGVEGVVPLARLAMSDTGAPLDEVGRARLFEPFAAESLGRGGGLGPAAAFGMVMQMGGRLEVGSDPGVTTLTMLLPAVEAAAGVEPPPLRESERETVLVAEDEDVVRLMIAESLERRGYRVLTACDGRDALAVANRFGGRIDLLLTDVAMPEMNGVLLARALRESRPEMRVMYMSGSPAEDVARDLEVVAGTGFVAKPITPSALAMRIRQALDEPFDQAMLAVDGQA